MHNFKESALPCHQKAGNIRIILVLTATAAIILLVLLQMMQDRLNPTATNQGNDPAPVPATDLVEETADVSELRQTLAPQSSDEAGFTEPTAITDTAPNIDTSTVTVTPTETVVESEGVQFGAVTVVSSSDDAVAAEAEAVVLAVDSAQGVLRLRIAGQVWRATVAADATITIDNQTVNISAVEIDDIVQIVGQSDKASQNFTITSMAVTGYVGASAPVFEVSE